jgi:hypothetical protein
MLKRPAKKHALVDSIDKMLAPESVSRLLNRPVNQVDCLPFESSNGFSANQLFHVTADDQPLVLKRMRPEKDWLAIGSDDNRCRAVRVWQYGLLDHIQPYIHDKTVAVCHDGESYAILMHDISPGLVSFGRETTLKMFQSMLDGLAAMHALFWEDEILTAPELGLCSMRARLTIYGTEKIHLYQHTPQIAEGIAQGFDALLDMVEPDVRDILQSLQQNPQPLSDALSNYPSTLAHGDYRLDNLAVMPDSGELVVFDWQNAAYIPATIDLCWFAMSGGVFHQKEECFHHYQQRLFNLLGNRFDHTLWPAMVDLGSLVTVMTIGNWHALFAATGQDPSYWRQSVDTYNDLVRRGVQWL